MSRRPIKWAGEVIASLVETDDGRRYLVPPIVFDTDGQVVLGREVLAAIAESGIAQEMPVLRNYSAGDLAALEQKLAQVSQTLGVEIRTV
jgi:hypothetical protein